MAFYTYDGDADVLYVLLVDLLVDDEDAAIHKTVQLSQRMHVDLDRGGNVLGVEILHARSDGVDLRPFTERFGIAVDMPLSFAV